jgi:hypothetical protein
MISMSFADLSKNPHSVRADFAANASTFLTGLGTILPNELWIE